MKRFALTLCVALAACDGCKRGGQEPVPGASSSATEAATPFAPVVGELLGAEHARDARAIDSELLSSRDSMVRRRAARALARIADERAAELLTRAIADEDPGVVTWSAYGLGYACKGREPATVRALVSRAAALAPDAAGPAAAEAELWDPIAAIADALARCATIEAEHTLRAWLHGSSGRAESAALALGRMASRNKRLDDASIVALLDAASRPDRPLDTALLAFSRLGTLSEPVQERLLSVAREGLSADGRRRAFAVRALGRAGTGAVEPLAALLVDSKSDPVLRAIAARELQKLGEPGQRVLADALGELLPAAPSERDLLAPSWLPIAATLEGLQSASRAQRALLEQLAELPLPKPATPPLHRRIVELRCRAAALLAGSASLYSKLVQCDPDVDGRIGKLAMLRVLDRGKLTGARYRRWRSLVDAKDAIVRQAALELLASHAEVTDAWEPLVSALRSERAGTVAVAARVLADHPDRGSQQNVAARPERAVVGALTHAFGVEWPADAVETRAALIDAAGALQLLSLKPRIAKHCDDDHPTLRLAAEKALHLLGERNRQCRRGKPGKPPRELAASLEPKESVQIALSTDAGELAITLEPTLAPVTVERISDLVRAGFYDGIVFHRVVPGFVVQFGDPGGDGYGGAGREPLRCETSPASFDSRSVGVALAGRDTGSSQLFVTLAAYPHLDGDYPLIGRAGPGWDRIAQGDIIHQARLAKP
jgi:cyclophilin family peptidyl-prolyl cis-trans isomerase